MLGVVSLKPYYYYNMDRMVDKAVIGYRGACLC